MTNERQIGLAMNEEVSSGRNGSALETHGSAPATRGVRRITYIEVVCEVPA
ncbi:hypothetical protein HDG32_001927 [Paraburkholderia sp. CI2]|nr:hypothetical protein [Paraburkholderia sp. CI2]